MPFELEQPIDFVNEDGTIEQSTHDDIERFDRMEDRRVAIEELFQSCCDNVECTYLGVKDAFKVRGMYENKAFTYVLGVAAVTPPGNNRSKSEYRVQPQGRQIRYVFRGGEKGADNFWLGIYRRQSLTVYCAWESKTTNSDESNALYKVNSSTIAKAAKYGLSRELRNRGKTAVCAFRTECLPFFLENRELLLHISGENENVQVDAELDSDGSVHRFEYDSLPEEFTTSFARRYITSLLAKPFVILTGNSGTGKTRISKRFAEYLEVRDEDDKPNWLLVPVGADWTDNTKVLGFYNPLANGGTGAYEETGILKLIERANAHPDVPYFLILDEMNLSHVERYFSDFLSHMETNGDNNLIALDGYEGEDEEGNTIAKLAYPKNLFVIGTVNIDETTYMFSPKVLDRANVIEFKPNKNDVLACFSTTEDVTDAAVAVPGIAQSFLSLAEEIRSDSDFINADDSVVITDVFGKLYDALEEHGFEFAFRTVREVRRYVNAAREFDGEGFDLERSIDEQIVQKVLPKLHGNKREIGSLLEELAVICDGKLSSTKISQMKTRLANVQYASFI